MRCARQERCNRGVRAPHKQLAAPFRAPINYHTSTCGPFQGPNSDKPTNHRSVYSDPWQNRWTNRSLRKWPLSSSRVIDLNLAAYLSPSRSLIGADLTACFGGALPFLMAGDLNTKHVDWNLRLKKRRGNSYVITLTRIPVSSLGRTPQPPTHTTPLLPPMSWTS
jgi:hypothetical protein